MNIDRSLPTNSRDASYMIDSQRDKIAQSQDPFQDPSYIIPSASSTHDHIETIGNDVPSQPPLSNRKWNRQAFMASRPVSAKSERLQIQSLEVSEPQRPLRPSAKVDLQQFKRTLNKVPSESFETSVMQNGPQALNPSADSSQSPRPMTAPQMTSSVPKQQVHRQRCRTCGKGLTTTGDNGTLLSYISGADCASCYEQRRGIDRTPKHAIPLPQARSPSAGVVPSSHPPSPTAAVTINAAHHKPCCNKCGRNRRHDQPSITPRHSSAPVGGQDVTPVSPSRTTPDRRTKSRAARTPPTSSQKAFSKIQAANTKNDFDGPSPDVPIDRPLDSFSTQEHSLLDRRGLRSLKIFRSSSISSSISRTFSRRKKTESEPPFSSNAISSRDRRSPSGFFRMLSRAIRSGDNEKYVKINTTDPVSDRPVSPYSFTGRPDEDEVFEMKDMRVSKLEPGYDKEILDIPYSTPIIIEPAPEPVMKSSHIRAKSEVVSSTSAITEYNKGANDLDQQQQPTLSRLKSLKGGVNRMASVTRSTSMKRFNSLKKTPELWYRSDMAFEGIVAVY